jgi:hypothetical protein
MAAGQTARTSSDGTFTLSGLSDFQDITLRAGKPGHYSATDVIRLTAGENRCGLKLAALPTNNLLLNGDFEQGFPSARSVEHGTSGKPAKSDLVKSFRSARKL